MHINSVLKAGAALATALLSVAAQPGVEKYGGRQVDLLIKGGLLYTGDLGPGKKLDIGIKSDRIVFVGNATGSRIRATRTIDARGLMVMPGMIDAHVHIDDELESKDRAVRRIDRQLLQGVTTSIIGVDGRGVTDVGAQAARLQAVGIGENYATYVGFGTLRQQVIGERPQPPSADELSQMRKLAAIAMCEGALGLSTSLFYAPQNFASTDEIIAVAKEAGSRGGLYDTHQRDEGDSTIGILASLTEAIRIGRESGATLHVAHLKVTGGWKANVDLMSEVIAKIEAARAQGQLVTADQYPWTSASTSLAGAVIPPWAHEGGREAMLRRFNTPADMERLRDRRALIESAADRIIINYAPSYPDVVGKSLGDLSRSWKVDALDAAIRILARTEDVSVTLIVMKEQDVTMAMKQPWVMTSSDGSDSGHPRGFATYQRLWVNYVMGQKVLTPSQFVYRSSGLVADTLGLRGRGYLKLGYFADIAVIDPKSYAPNATFEQPTRLSSGVVALVVNGKLAVESGKPTGVLAGRALRKIPTAGTCAK